jgi:P-type Mg2+ transporter
VAILNLMKALYRKMSGFEIHSDEIETAVTSTYSSLTEAALMSLDDVTNRLNTSKNGLSNYEAEKRLAKYGKNLVSHERPLPWYWQLLKAFLDPFIGVLVILAIASFVIEFVFALPQDKDLTSVIIITILILISVTLTFIQEYQASQAADKLLDLIKNTTIVIREETGRQARLNEEIVPGDIIYLSAGDIIPADVRLFSTNNLSVNEATLTGESLPVDKFDHLERSINAEDNGFDSVFGINPLDLDNIGYQGTNIVSGSARAVVLATGKDSILGSMSEELVGHHPPSSFDEGVKSVSLLLIRFMVVMVPIIFLVNGLARGNWLQALLFGLAVAVGLTPEMLPTIVTVNLAKGSIEMAQRQTVVKRLSAIQNLGAMDVLCTDKTGTLTYDSVALENYLNLRGEKDGFVFKLTYLNSFFQTGLRNPLDEAVLSHPNAEEFVNIDDKYLKIDEIPFETARRRMSVIVKNEDGEYLLVCKGAVEEMLSISTHVKLGDRIQKMSADLKLKINKDAELLIKDGLRVLLVGFKPVASEKTIFDVNDEDSLILVGSIGFLDPPKETSGEAIRALNDKGIRVIVITGDNEIATRRVCREIGFEISGLSEGNEVEHLSDDGLQQTVKTTNVFVRTTPLQKSRILNAIKNNGHTVGFLGDGINDAIALRDADVGISVDNAVDIAKESADILLLEKSLMVLEEGVSRGRLVFGNIMKYIKMTISSNFGNVFSVLVASMVLPFPPMLPLHLLIQNLLYDISQLSIPWDRMDEEYLAEPRSWSPKSITRFTMFIGPVSSIFDFSTFALLWFILGANSAENQSLFHSGWFVLGLLSQTLIVHLIRTKKTPFIQSTASRPVIVMTGIIMLVGLMIPFSNFGINIGMRPLPWNYFPWLAITLVAYCSLVELVKRWYITRFNTWL